VKRTSAEYSVIGTLETGCECVKRTEVGMRFITAYAQTSCPACAKALSGIPMHEHQTDRIVDV